jgi:hypothetical protein
MGCGNFYIFYQLVQAVSSKEILKGDLVLVCWASALREDRITDGRWIGRGNVWHMQCYSEEFVLNYADEYFYRTRDESFILAARSLLENAGIDFLFFSSYLSGLKGLDKLSFDEHLPTLSSKKRPSFKQDTIIRVKDDHPTPIEHLKYVDDIITPSLATTISITEDYRQKLTKLDRSIWRGDFYTIPFPDEIDVDPILLGRIKDETI